VGATTLLSPHLATEQRSTRRRGYVIAKRVMDVVVASVLLLVAVPILLPVAIIIKLDSPGPVVFKQQRLRGRWIVEDGEPTWEIRPFTLYKLRTMVAGADPRPHQEYMAAYIAGDEQHFAATRAGRRPGDSYRPDTDPRVTRCGEGSASTNCRNCGTSSRAT
jgi:lipopolysaccharide/colanic/teichoic acid biosynthesis glycosyltransferase